MGRQLFFFLLLFLCFVARTSWALNRLLARGFGCGLDVGIAERGKKIYL